MNRKVDAVIIGGGIIGAFVGYYLVKENIRVALVEKGDIAGETSSSCIGNVGTIDITTGLGIQLALESQKIYYQLSQELEYDFEYRQKGNVLIIENEEQMEDAKKIVNKQQAVGVPTRLMDEEEIHENEPLLADDILGAIESSSGSALNPMYVVYGLVETLKKRGDIVLPFTEVTAIKLSCKNAVEAVVTSRGLIKTGIVVNAAGVWAPKVGSMVGVEIPIIPQRGQVLVSERTPPIVRCTTMEFGSLIAEFGEQEKNGVGTAIRQFDISFVIQPTPSENFLIGTSTEFVGFDKRNTYEVMSALARRAIRFFPIISKVNIIRSYAGLRPYTLDHLPIISGIDGVPGFYIAAGHGGDGVGEAPITGKLASELIVGKRLSFPQEKLALTRPSLYRRR